SKRHPRSHKPRPGKLSAEVVAADRYKKAVAWSGHGLAPRKWRTLREESSKSATRTKVVSIDDEFKDQQLGKRHPTLFGRFLMRALLSIVWAVWLVFLAGQPALADKRVALVIGNSAY